MAPSGLTPIPGGVCAWKLYISSQVQKCLGFSRADSQYRMGHFLPRSSPDAGSVLDANPRPEFILKHYIFSLMDVRLRTQLYT